MTDLGEFWIGICIIMTIAIAVVMVLFAVTWQKINLIYDILRKKMKW